MVAAQKVMHSFLADAQRLCAQAREYVRQLSDQADRNRISPAQVRSLYQVIHTLKGTSAMVEGATSIEEALQQLEGRLACRSLVDSARDPSWIPLARTSVERAQQALTDLQRKRRSPAPISEPLVRGIMLRTVFQERAILLWFPLSCITRVYSYDEVPETGMMCVRGSLVPVLGGVAPSQAQVSLAVAVRSQAGQAVLRAEEVVKICAWSKAAADGASPGLDIFAGRLQVREAS